MTTNYQMKLSFTSFKHEIWIIMAGRLFRNTIDFEIRFLILSKTKKGIYFYQ